MSSNGLRTNFPKITIINLPSWYKHPWKPQYEPGIELSLFIWCPRCGEYKNKFMTHCDICNELCEQIRYRSFGSPGIPAISMQN